MLNALPYQIDGIKFLAANNRGFLFDDPGLGKTFQAVRAADEVEARRVLAIVPANIVIQWQNAHEEIAQMKREFIAVSYDKVRDKGIDASDFDVCIIDEGHLLKNRSAGRTKAVYGPKCEATGGIVEKIPYVWELTGSPAPNNASELWTKLRALTPKAITMKSGKIMGYWDFVERFCSTVNNGFGIQITGSKNIDVLKERIAPHMIRRRKDDPKIMADRKKPIIGTLRLSASESAKAMRNIDSGPEGRMIAAALESGAEGLKSLTTHVASYRRLTGLAKVGPVVSQLIDEFEGGLQKIVVIAYHTDVIEGIRAGLERQGIGAAVYEGRMSHTAKENAKTAFRHNANCKAFIGQITAAGTGTDGLQEVCKDMILAEWSWVPEENKQIIGRLDRLGQGNEVLARFVVLSGSLDEKMGVVVARKTADITALFG